MRTLTIGVEDDATFRSRIMAIADRLDAGQGYQGEFYTFPSLTLLFDTFNPRRLELLRKLQSIGPTSLRGLARALQRDVKRVHEDVSVLLEKGVIERDATKRLTLPYDRIHVDVEMTAPATAAE